MGGGFRVGVFLRLLGGRCVPEAWVSPESLVLVALCIPDVWVDVVGVYLAFISLSVCVRETSDFVKIVIHSCHCFKLSLGVRSNSYISIFLVGFSTYQTLSLHPRERASDTEREGSGLHHNIPEPVHFSSLAENQEVLVNSFCSYVFCFTTSV